MKHQEIEKIVQFKITSFLSIIILQLSLMSSALSISKTPISDCLEIGDSSTCLLNLAISRADTIKDLNKRSNAYSQIILAYADINKENENIIRKAYLLLDGVNRSAIEPSNLLDLNLSMNVYLNSIDKKQAVKSVSSLYKQFNSFKESTKQSERLDAFFWSCFLFGSGKYSWELTKYIFINECTNKNISKLKASNDEEIELIKLINLERNLGWSNLDEFRKNFDEIFYYYEGLAKSPLTKKNNVANIYFPLLASLKILQADATVRFKSYQDSESYIDEAASYIGKINTMEKEGFTSYLSIKNTLVEFYQSWGRITIAEKTLSNIQGAVEGNIVKQKTSNSEEIKYLTLLSTIRFQNKQLTLADRLNIERSQQLRQADVLYLTHRNISKYKSELSQEMKEYSLEILLEAANNNHPIAMYEMGLLLSNGGLGISQNLVSASKWYTLSALSGFAGAQNNLGDLYEKGLGVKKSINEAIYWYTQSAMQGEPTAYYSLGDIYAKGKEVEQNDERALFWLILASKNLPEGSNKKNAIATLEIVSSRLTKDQLNLVSDRVLRFQPLSQTEFTLGDSNLKNEN